MNDFWLPTPKVKFYEALGAVADERLFDITETSANVYSSKRDKFYQVVFEPETNSINSNDNSTYYVGYLGYPAISFLLANDYLPYKSQLAECLSGVEWKKINQKYKNDFTSALNNEVLSMLDLELVNELNIYVDGLSETFNKLSLKKLGSTQVPPKSIQIVS